MENKYKNQLSPFGRDVMDVMMRQWRRGHDTELSNGSKAEALLIPRDITRNRRILTFNNTVQPNNLFTDPTLLSRHIEKPYTANDPGAEDYNDDLPFEFEPDHVAALPAVATSLQLVVPTTASCPQSALPPACSGYSREDLKTANLSQGRPRKAIFNLYNEGSEIEPDNDLQVRGVLRKLDEHNSNSQLVHCERHLDKKNMEKITPHDVTLSEANIGEIRRYEEFDNKMNGNKLIQCEDADNTSKEVNWNNMFDTEILSQADPLKDMTFENIVVDQCKNVNEKENIMLHNTSKDNNLKGIQIISNDEVINPEIFKKKSGKKRKAQANISDTVSKKVKKIPSEKKKSVEASIRKQSYKKTVNKWLETVTPSYAVSEDTTRKYALKKQPQKKESLKNTETGGSESEREINADASPPGNKSKKVIQAQLANKGGVMKFKKPKKEDTTFTDNTTGSTKSESTNTKAVIATETTSKDKKPKSKFPAFKSNSQIPIKDITYDIVILDENNFVEHRNNILYDESIEDIVIVLLYRNGFNQLNRQQTDDSCVPEGLMLSIGEKFYYIKHTDFANLTKIKDVFIDIMTTKNIICYEGKSILIYLATEFELDLTEHEFKIEDLQIGGSLLEPDEPPQDFSALEAMVSPASESRAETPPAPAPCARQRCARLARRLRGCGRRLRPELARQALDRVFWDIEMRIVPIVADMELRGICVDLDKLRGMESCLLERMKQVERECYRAAGKTFQINSAPQVRGILFEELRLDARLRLAVRETAATGAKSTSETVLRQLAAAELHALPRLILEYRHLHKAHATFLVGVAQHVVRGVVKPTWLQTAAATGRVACSAPNLQAIPKAPFSLTLFPDPDLAEAPTLNFRSVYVAREGRTLLAADFRHVECRVFAHAAADAALQHALAARADLFRVLAAAWLHKPEAAVAGEERERTKRVVYASLYGAGARKLADLLRCEPAHAQELIDGFHHSFPALRSFGRAVAARCAAAGGRLSTASGRARRLPLVAAADPALRARAHRQALNFLVQGSAADLCKRAMADTVARLRAAAPPLPARLVLQVHDELLWELRPADLARAAEIIRTGMEGCAERCGMTLRLPVNLAHGRTWGNLRPLP